MEKLHQLFLVSLFVFSMGFSISSKSNDFLINNIKNNNSTVSQFSALWYNPQQPGHGLSLYMQDDNRIIVFWYVFDSEAQPLWLLGQGTVSHESAELDVIRAQNGVFPPDFDPDNVEYTNWGQFKIEFIDCNTINFHWLANNPSDFSSGSLEFKRLIQTLGVEAECESKQRPAVPDNMQQWLLGDSENKFANLSDPAILLMGGGSDVDQAFSQRVRAHIGADKDVVVIRAEGGDGYNEYLKDLLDANSVETLIIDSREVANNEYVDWVISTAEFVWVAGGDQSQYLQLWKNTKLQSALQSVYDKGGIIGGTSAGMALLAGSVYDPGLELGAVSSEVVLDFCHSSLNFHESFLNIPLLTHSLTDTHFVNRDRMGRALVSLGHHNSGSLLIAANESSSIFIELSGQAWVDGDAVYVLYEDNETERTILECQQEVVYENLIRVKLQQDQSIDLSNKTHNGIEIEVSINGQNTEFYSPINPY